MQKRVILGVLIALCIVVLIVLICTLGNGSSTPYSCQKAADDTLEFMSTKAPYIHHSEQFSNSPDGCTAEKVWHFNRHGTRNPGLDEIFEMLNDLPELLLTISKNYEEGRGLLCSEELNDLKSWVPYKGLNATKQKHLVEQGKQELLEIGKRYRERYPEFFPSIFSNETYFFKYTDSQRTEASARAFVTGLLGEAGAESVWFPPAEKADPIIKFYEGCTKWQKEVNKNPDAYAEKIRFEKSEYMNQTLKSVSERLGFLQNLTLREVNMIYLTCSFETAWEGGRKISPWCAALSEQDFRAMNFREDLDYYWIDGYGQEINYQQACPPIKDVVNTFDDTNSTRKLTGYFSHSGANIKMLARLGLFKDVSPLKVADFQEQKENRKWNTSSIDTMASNMAFVLYSCPSQNPSTRIGYFFQEKPRQLDACDGNWHCPYEKFKENIANIISNCDLQTICKDK